MKGIIFEADTYEDQLATLMLEALEKEGIISVASKGDLLNEIREEVKDYDAGESVGSS